MRNMILILVGVCLVSHVTAIYSVGFTPIAGALYRHQARQQHIREMKAAKNMSQNVQSNSNKNASSGGNISQSGGNTSQHEEHNNYNNDDLCADVSRETQEILSWKNLLSPALVALPSAVTCYKALIHGVNWCSSFLCPEPLPSCAYNYNAPTVVNETPQYSPDPAPCAPHEAISGWGVNLSSIMGILSHWF